MAIGVIRRTATTEDTFKPVGLVRKQELDVSSGQIAMANGISALASASMDVGFDRAKKLSVKTGENAYNSLSEDEFGIDAQKYLSEEDKKNNNENPNFGKPIAFRRKIGGGSIAREHFEVLVNKGYYSSVESMLNNKNAEFFNKAIFEGGNLATYETDLSNFATGLVKYARPQYKHTIQRAAAELIAKNIPKLQAAKLDLTNQQLKVNVVNQLQQEADILSEKAATYGAQSAQVNTALDLYNNNISGVANRHYKFLFSPAEQKAHQDQLRIGLASGNLKFISQQLVENSDTRENEKVSKAWSSVLTYLKTNTNPDSFEIETFNKLTNNKYRSKLKYVTDNSVSSEINNTAIGLGQLQSQRTASILENKVIDNTSQTITNTKKNRMLTDQIGEVIISNASETLLNIIKLERDIEKTKTTNPKLGLQYEIDFNNSQHKKTLVSKLIENHSEPIVSNIGTIKLKLASDPEAGILLDELLGLGKDNINELDNIKYKSLLNKIDSLGVIDESVPFKEYIKSFFTNEWLTDGEGLTQAELEYLNIVDDNNNLLIEQQLNKNKSDIVYRSNNVYDEEARAMLALTDQENMQTADAETSDIINDLENLINLGSNQEFNIEQLEGWNSKVQEGIQKIASLYEGTNASPVLIAQKQEQYQAQAFFKLSSEILDQADPRNSKDVKFLADLRNYVINPTDNHLNVLSDNEPLKQYIDSSRTILEQTNQWTKYQEATKKRINHTLERFELDQHDRNVVALTNQLSTGIPLSQDQAKSKAGEEVLDLIAPNPDVPVIEFAQGAGAIKASIVRNGTLPPKYIEAINGLLSQSPSWYSQNDAVNVVKNLSSIIKNTDLNVHTGSYLQRLVGNSGITKPQLNKILALSKFLTFNSANAIEFNNKDISDFVFTSNSGWSEIVSKNELLDKEIEKPQDYLVGVFTEQLLDHTGFKNATPVEISNAINEVMPVIKQLSLLHKKKSATDERYAEQNSQPILDYAINQFENIIDMNYAELTNAEISATGSTSFASNSLNAIAHNEDEIEDFKATIINDIHTNLNIKQPVSFLFGDDYTKALESVPKIDGGRDDLQAIQEFKKLNKQIYLTPIGNNNFSVTMLDDNGNVDYFVGGDTRFDNQLSLWEYNINQTIRVDKSTPELIDLLNDTSSESFQNDLKAFETNTQKPTLPEQLGFKPKDIETMQYRKLLMTEYKKLLQKRRGNANSTLQKILGFTQ